jgi:hypothetical protein
MRTEPNSRTANHAQNLVFLRKRRAVYTVVIAALAIMIFMRSVSANRLETEQTLPVPDSGLPAIFEDVGYSLPQANKIASALYAVGIDSVAIDRVSDTADANLNMVFCIPNNAKKGEDEIYIITGKGELLCIVHGDTYLYDDGVKSVYVP